MTSDLLEQRPGFVWAGASAQVLLAGPGAPVLATLRSFGVLEPLGPPHAWDITWETVDAL